MSAMLSPVWAPDRYVRCLWKAPGHSGLGPRWPNRNVHPHQAAEQGACDGGPAQAEFKFPGRQKIHISKKWGFTKFNVDEYENMVVEKWLIPDSCGIKYIPNCGPLDKWQALHS